LIQLNMSIGWQATKSTFPRNSKESPSTSKPPTPMVQQA
jgi:hypothetical protein